MQNNTNIRNIIGIDLGTTYSAVAQAIPQIGGKTIKAEIIKNGDGRNITPSVIQFLPDGGIVFGDEAKEAAEFGEDGCAQTFKRSMGSSDVYCAFYGKTYTAEDLSALLLTHLKEEAERSLGGKIDSAVVTVPAYFRDAERRSTMNAAKRAGLNVLCLLDEPVAAAINYGMGHWRDNAVIMVYDLGGGTFDVTIVKMENGHLETMYTAGNHVLGGKDWDNALVDIVCRKYYEETGERIDEDIAIRHAIGTEIEETKKALSMTNSHRTVVDLPGIGSYSCQITRTEFESETLPLLNNTTALCNQLLRDAGLNWKNITDILLVGGSTRMPQVKQCLKSISGLTPLEGIVNPDEAVALGAAIRAHALDEAGELAYVRPDAKKEGSKYVEVCLPKGRVGRETSGDELMIATPTVRLSHALGVVAVDEVGPAYTNQVIIPTNSRVPCSTARKFKFYTSPKGPNILEIYMLEGDGELFSSECQFLAKYEVEGITHVRGGADIEIQYSKDLSSITHVQVRQGDEKNCLPIREVPLDDTRRFTQKPEIKMGSGDVRDLRLAVTGECFDDIGALLKDMGLSVQPFIQTGFDCDVLFINCGTPDVIDPTQLRNFVIDGGCVYVSDLAVDHLTAAFPDAIVTVKQGKAGMYPAKIVDPELKSIIGNSISVVYDLGVWAIIQKHKGDCLIRGASVDMTNPMMVTFAEGKGKVFYTSYHNHSQASEAEQSVLKLMLLRQIGEVCHHSIETVGEILGLNIPSLGQTARKR